MWDFVKAVFAVLVFVGLCCLPDVIVKFMPDWMLLTLIAVTFAGLIAFFVWVVKQIVND